MLSSKGRSVGYSPLARNQPRMTMMTQNAEPKDWTRGFDALNAIGDATRTKLRQSAPLVTAPAEHRLFAIGDACEKFYFVLQGSARVRVLTAAGREATLYRVGPGETCLLTVCGLLTGERYAAEGVVETPIRAAALSRERFFALFDTDSGFRRFALNALGGRLASVLSALGEVAFGGLDRRLAAALLAAVDDGGRITATHANIAADIGAARETVSRRLKAMEDDGLILRSRGGMEIVDAGALTKIATAEDL